MTDPPRRSATADDVAALVRLMPQVEGLTGGLVQKRRRACEMLAALGYNTSAVDERWSEL